MELDLSSEESGDGEIQALQDIQEAQRRTEIMMMLMAVTDSSTSSDSESSDEDSDSDMNSLSNSETTEMDFGW